MRMKRSFIIIIAIVLSFVVMSCASKDKDTKSEVKNDRKESVTENKDTGNETELNIEDSSLVGLDFGKEEAKEEFSLEGAAAFVKDIITDTTISDNEKIMRLYFPALIDCFIENDEMNSGRLDGFEYEYDFSDSGVMTAEELDKLLTEYKEYDSYFSLSEGAYLTVKGDGFIGYMYVGYEEGKYYFLGASMASTQTDVTTAAE